MRVRGLAHLTTLARWGLTLLASVLLTGAAVGLGYPWGAGAYGLSRWNPQRGGYDLGVRAVFEGAGVELAVDNRGVGSRRWAAVQGIHSWKIFPRPAWNVIWKPSARIEPPGSRATIGGWWSVFIPGWMLLVSATPIAWWWVRRSRRPRPGRCVGCGYSLDGLPAGSACPECGGRPTA